MHPLQAIIDLGTNTFHLMLFYFENDNLIVFDKKQVVVKLGEGGINQKTIAPKAFDRGINALKYFKEVLNENNVAHVKCFGTSAIRNAMNGKSFIEQAKILTDLDIHIIDGNIEADLISTGVIYTLDNNINEGLIMDIGGGSVEFVIFKNNERVWHRSYEIGVARLLENFHQNDPISLGEIDSLEIFLEVELEELLNEIENANVFSLIGSAGTFESLIMLSESNTQITDLLDEISLQDFYKIYETIINSSLNGRKEMEGLEDYRIEMIVVAVVLIKFIIQKGKMKTIFCSKYSLKEGAAILHQKDNE